MQAQEPMTQTIKASEARQQFSRVLNQVFRKETRVIVEKSGIPVAVIVSTDDFNSLKQLEEAQREEDFKALDATRKALKDVSDIEIEREVVKALRQVRSQNRQRNRINLPAA
jgi:prevent-host-death family protein